MNQVVVKGDVVKFGRTEIDLSNPKASSITKSLGTLHDLWRKGNLALHLAAVAAIYHAQQHGNADALNAFYAKFHPEREKGYMASLRKWCGEIATVEMPGDEESVTIEMKWLVFRENTFKVKAGSENYRKNARNLSVLAEGAPFYAANLENDKPAFDDVALFAMVEKAIERAIKKGEEEGIEIEPRERQRLVEMQTWASNVRVAHEAARTETVH